MRLVRLGNLYYDEELLDRVGVFADREDAGDRLGSACREVLGSADAVYAIPMGGVPVGAGVAKALSATLDLLICRKLLIPWNREAGFGAVAPDGTVYVDRELARQLGLGDEDVRAAVEEQLEEVKRRNRVLRGGRGYPSLAGKAVVVVDDGIAAGYTMRAAVEFLRCRLHHEGRGRVPQKERCSARLRGRADRPWILCDGDSRDCGCGDMP
ncbi:phosphoribosyltransferase [Candidatus Geothermarchaeota archaeon ex4572_27]|nr:MAG: phosphoribosyltransferase [Candidatus Geothermarchaeota archaeon ex4572_27]